MENFTLNLSFCYWLCSLNLSFIHKRSVSSPSVFCTLTGLIKSRRHLEPYSRNNFVKPDNRVIAYGCCTENVYLSQWVVWNIENQELLMLPCSSLCNYAKCDFLKDGVWIKVKIILSFPQMSGWTMSDYPLPSYTRAFPSEDWPLFKRDKGLDQTNGCT